LPLQALQFAALVVVHVVARLGERALELAAGVLGVDIGEEVGRDLDLGLRRQLGIQQRCSPLLAGLGNGRVELGGDHGREHRERQRDAGMPDREDPGDVTARQLGQQLAGEGRQCQPHPRAGQHLRRHGPPGRGRRQERQAADATGDQQAARHCAGLGVALYP
jgi:hypothetical protein